MSEPLVRALALDHVGIAAAGPEVALPNLMGSSLGEGKRMPSGVIVGRFGPDAALELVWPGRETSPLSSFLARRGPGLHHVAFQVSESMQEVAARLAAAGLELTGPVQLSSDGRPSLFIHPRSTGGVLIELVEGSK